MMPAPSEPYYFGPDEALFGVYHPPGDVEERPVGIVLCYPLGQEYMRAHRAFVQMAKRLSAEGFHVLRFDFSGCGDSADPVDDGEPLHRWQDDIGVAIEELVEGCGVEQIVLCGLRLGASLATLAAAARGGVDGLVLWDPIPRGAPYLDGLVEQHAAWLRDSFAKGHASAGEATEILGFPVSTALRDDLRGLDLGQLSRCPAERVLAVDTPGGIGSGPALERMGALGAQVEVCVVDELPSWTKQTDEVGNVAVPVRVIEAIVAGLGQWYA